MSNLHCFQFSHRLSRAGARRKQHIKRTGALQELALAKRINTVEVRTARLRTARYLASIESDGLGLVILFMLTSRWHCLLPAVGYLVPGRVVRIYRWPLRKFWDTDQWLPLRSCTLFDLSTDTNIHFILVLGLMPQPSTHAMGSA